MTLDRPDRRRARAELREIFWEWDPLNLASERDGLPGEYDGQAERTLRILEEDGDTAAVGADLSAWLDRSTPPGWRARDPRTVDQQADRLVRWWVEFLATPPPDREPPVWRSPSISVLLLAWLAVVAGSVALRFDDIATILADPLFLAASVASLAFALLPAAAIIGAPKVATANPRLLAGSILLVLSEAFPGLIDGLGLIYPFDVFEDPVRFTLAQNAVAVLQLSLTVGAAWLLVVGLRRLGAAPDRWARWAILLAVGLVPVGYVAAFAAYGHLWVESVSANIASLLWSIAIGWPGLFATAAMFVFALAGVRAHLSPPSAWFLAALGFGAWLLAPVASAFSLIVGQAAPELGVTWIAGYTLGLVADIATPAAFLAGLGGGGATPPWMPWLRGRWRGWRGQTVAPTM